MDSRESIEDLLLKLYDLGFSESIDLSCLMSTPVDTKVDIAVSLANDIHKAKEVIYIIDAGCVVTYDRKIAEWFLTLCSRISHLETVIFCIIARYRPTHRYYREPESIFIMDVPELNKAERQGLLKRVSEDASLDLARDDLQFFSNLLSGYPEQAFFVVNSIVDSGLSAAKDNTDLIVEYNSLKVQHLLSKWEKNDDAINFLRLLAEFDFISQDLVFEIVDDPKYRILIDEFRASAFLELDGANNEYIRVIDNVRDYIFRLRLKLTDAYRKKLESHVETFLATYKNEEKDISDFLFSMKASLLSGKPMDERYLIPSQFLKSIKELYDQRRRYSEVVRLADRVLSNTQYLDKSFLTNVRYYLCLALARQKNARCLDVAQEFSGAEHEFILGFYYRLRGRYEDAIERLTAALSRQPEFARARRELVIVLSYIGEYEKAFTLAKQNYESDKTNPYHIQAYLNCLMRGSHKTDTSLIKQLLAELGNIRSEVAQEMFRTAGSEYFAFLVGNEQRALDLIKEARELYPSVIYPVLIEFDIYVRFNNVEGMKSILDELSKEVDSKSYLYNSFIRRKCIYISRTEGYDAAILLMDKHLGNFTESAKERFKAVLLNCSMGQTKDCVI